MPFKSVNPRPNSGADKSRKSEFAKEALTPPEPKIVNPSLPADQREATRPAKPDHDPRPAAEPSSEQNELDRNEAGLREGDTASEPAVQESTPQAEFTQPDAAPSPAPAQQTTPRPSGSKPPSGTAKSPIGGRQAGSKKSDGLSMLSDLANSAGSAASSSPLGRVGKSLKFMGRHKKIFFAGGALATFLLLGVLAFFTFLPMKLQVLTKSIITHETARMNKYVSMRVDAIVFRYLYGQVTGNLASDGYFVGKGPIRTLYGNMQLNKFEQKLAEKGIKLEKTGPSSVRIVSNGVDIGTANSGQEMANLFNTDLRGRQARASIQFLVKETYPSPLQFLKRRHLRLYVRNAYNIRRWNIKKQEEVKSADADMPGSTLLAIQSNIIDPGEDMTISTVDCATGTGNCPDNDTRKNPDGSSTMRPPLPNADRVTRQSSLQAADTTKQGLRDSYKNLRTSTNHAIESGLSNIFGKAISQSILKTVPFIGWFHLAADLDHFFWGGTLRKIAIYLHSAQYASVAMTWASLADQAKAGELTASQINVINESLDNIEQSNAVQRIFFEKDQGIKLANEKRVGSDSGTVVAAAQPAPGCDFGWYSQYGNVIPSSGSREDYFTWAYRRAASFPYQIHVPLCLIRVPLQAVSDAINAIFGPVIEASIKAIIDTVNAVGTVLTGRPFDVVAMAQEALMWMLNQIWTPVATGRETGPALGNAFDAGWDVTANQMCRDVLGCKNIDHRQAYLEQSQIAASTRQEVASRGPLASLFSTDSPQTFGSQMIAMMPTTPGTALSNTSSFATAVISNPMKYLGAIASSFSAPTHAVFIPARQPNGVQQTGYDEAAVMDYNLHVATEDVRGPIGADGNPTGPDGRIDQYDCPIIPDASVTNQCLLDTAAAQVMCASFSNDDDGGLGGYGAQGDCGEASIPSASATPADVLANNEESNKPFNFWGIINWGVR